MTDFLVDAKGQPERPKVGDIVVQIRDGQPEETRYEVTGLGRTIDGKKLIWLKQQDYEICIPLEEIRVIERKAKK
jgi:hypothetical protein